MLGSFDKSVWNHVRSDLKRFAKDRIALPLEGIVAFGAVYALLAQIGSADAASDFGIEKLLAAPIAFAILVAIHVLWSMGAAPRRIYYEQQAEQLRLRNTVQQLQDDLQDARSLLPEAASPALPAKPLIGQLRIEYDKKNHFTRHPNGDVEVKFLLRNLGPGRAKRVRVKLESIEPMKSKNLAWSTQFPSIRLKVSKERLGFDLHPNDICEVRLIRAEKAASQYSIDGYGEESQPDEFHVRRDRYQLKVVATAMDGGADEQTFHLTPKRNGEIDVDMLQES